MRIEPLPARSRAAAIQLWRDTGLTRPWNDPAQDLDRALTGPDSTILAAFLDEGEELLGTAMLGHDGHRGWVYYLAVRPDRQGQGLGRSLLRACEDWVRERGIVKIQLMVRTGNDRALEFYRGLGYEVAETTVLGRRLD
jgi:ribosomal protein S18 acetylase RimI-like enzyme